MFDVIKRGYEDIQACRSTSVFSSLSAVSLDTFAKRITVKRCSTKGSTKGSVDLASIEDDDEDDDEDSSLTEKSLIIKYKLLKIQAKKRIRKFSITNILNRKSFGSLFSMSSDSSHSMNYDLYSDIKNDVFNNDTKNNGLLSSKEEDDNDIGYYCTNENENNDDKMNINVNTNVSNNVSIHINDKNRSLEKDKLKDKDKDKEFSPMNKNYFSIEKDNKIKLSINTNLPHQYVTSDSSLTSRENIVTGRLLWQPSYSTSKKPPVTKSRECCSLS